VFTREKTSILQGTFHKFSVSFRLDLAQNDKAPVTAMLERRPA